MEFITIVAAVVQILILVAFYGIIKYFGNCPVCGRRIPNDEKVCGFCGTPRRTIPAGQTRLRCDSCGGTFGIEESQKGTMVQCPHCKESSPTPPPRGTAKRIIRGKSESQVPVAQPAASVLPENARQVKWTSPSQRPHEVPSSKGSQKQVEAAPGEKPQEQPATLRARCSKCGEIFEVLESQRGTTVRCPHCQQNLQVK